MLGEDRRSIDELVALYALEPEVYDIYVEGVFDQILIKKFFQDHDVRRVKIYEVDAINVPDDFVVEVGQNPGSKKGRVVALAKAICSKVKGPKGVVSCVVDLDDDHFLEKKENLDCLLYTDYANMEMYFFSPHVLERFFEIYMRYSTEKVSVAMNALKEVLQDAFVYRIAHQKTCPHVSWPNIIPFCKVKKKGGAISFDETRVWKYFLSNQVSKDKKDSFDKEFNKNKAKISGDPRMQMHGHDFVSMLCFYLKWLGNPEVAIDPISVERVLCTHLSHKELASEGLFSELLARVQGFQTRKGTR